MNDSDANIVWLAAMAVIMFYFCRMAKKTIVAAGGLVQNEYDEVLLIFRRGVWDMPKGKLDEGESIAECAVREVEEETGLRNVILGEFIDHTYHDYFDKWSKKEVLKETHWYAMRIEGNQALVPQKEEDIEEILWVQKSELVNYMNNMHKNIVHVLRKFLSLTKA